MSNEELAAAIQAGERDRIMELWEQVRRFAFQQARRWAYLGRGGVSIDDLMQCAFLALLAALEGWKPEAGAFLTWYGFRLKAAFTEATGQRTKRERLDPLDTAASIDKPLDEGEGEALTLADVIPDPQAAEALEGVGAWDTLYRAVDGLPEAQREAVRRRYWLEQDADNKALQAALRKLRHPRISSRIKVNFT